MSAGWGSRAACYATKYLTKVPEHGFPRWVLEFEGRIRRHEKSRNFFAVSAHKNPYGHDNTCSEHHSSGEILVSKERRRQRTTQEILAGCGQDAALMLVQEVEVAGVELVDKYVFLGKLKDGWKDVRRYFGHGDDSKVVRLVVPAERQADVLEKFGVGLPVTLPSPASSPALSDHSIPTTSAPPTTSGNGNEQTLEAPHIEEADARRLRDEFAGWIASGTNPSGLTPAAAGQQEHEDRRLWAARTLGVQVQELAEIDGWLTMAARVARGKEHQPGCFCEACRGARQDLPPPAAA